MNNLSFVGTTHLDINYSISNLVYSTSNILESHIYNTSNILESHIYDAKNYNINYTNILRSNVNKWINEEVEHITTPTVIDKTHTYIYNSNLSGEIRFFCKSTPLFPPQIPGDYPTYRVKIDADGKLKLYYTYDSTINLTWLNGWVDIINLAVSLVASDTNLGASIGAVQLEVGTLNQKVDFEVERIYNALAVIEAGDLEQDLESLNEYRAASRNSSDNPTATMNINSAYTNIRNLISTRNTTYLSRIQNSLTAAILQNPITAFVTGAGGAVLGIIYGIAQGVSFDGFLNSLTKEIDSNSNLTPTEKTNLKNYITDDLMVQNAINIASLEYNKGLAQGFINSNITTAQTIPNIKTSNITINNTGSTTYSLINFSNATNNSAGYVGLGGIVSGYHNNNMIYNTPGAHVFNVPGQTSTSIPAFAINSFGNVGIGINPSAYPLYRFSVSGDIYTTGALRTNSLIYNSQELSTSLSYYLLKSGGTLTGPLTLNTGLYADPGPYPNGFNGDRIILNTGIGTNGYPYSVGINTDVFWHSAPTTASYKFYSGATNTATLNNVGLLTLPSISATTSITTSSIIYGGTELSNTYLKLAGGTMSGQLAITANSANSLISLTNTHTIGQGILQTNNLGGYARLTYYNSGAGGYYTANYVLEASSNSAAIIMNTGGNTSNSIPRFILNSSGNIGIGISNPSNKLEVAGNISQTGNTFTIGNSTGGVTLNLTDILNAAWQIKTGGYNLSFFNNDGGTFSNRVVFMRNGNVGIGTDTAASLLHIKGTNPQITVMAQGGSGASSTLNLTTYNNTTNQPNCSLSATDNGNYGCTFQIKQKLEGADTNGQFTSFIIDKDGNAAFGNTTYASTKLYVNGKTRFEDIVTYTTGAWNTSKDGVFRTHYGTLSTSYYSCGSNGSEAHYFMKSAAGNYGPIMIMYNDGMVMASGDNLRFPDTLNQFKINLWGTNVYGFGIASGTLMYSSQNWHKFYNYNVNTFTIDNNGDVSILRNLVTGGLTRSRHYFNYGTTLSYQSSLNGTNGGGWYWVTNGFWDGISTVSYLCVAITCTGISSAVWFGRIFLGGGGGQYACICDLRTPNGGTNTINVDANIWDSGGTNAIKITIDNATYGNTFTIKISG